MRPNNTDTDLIPPFSSIQISVENILSRLVRRNLSYVFFVHVMFSFSNFPMFFLFRHSLPDCSSTFLLWSSKLLQWLTEHPNEKQIASSIDVSVAWHTNILYCWWCCGSFQLGVVAGGDGFLLDIFGRLGTLIQLRCKSTEDWH